MSTETKINKVIFGGTTLIDLTSDTVTKETLLEGQTAHNAAGEVITGKCTFDANTSDATATATEILSGKTAYRQGAKVTGTMPNNAAVAGIISTVDLNAVDENGKKLYPYIIPRGYHDGSGTVQISATELEKLIPENIRDGVNLLGIDGSMTGLEDVHAQSKNAIPKVSSQTILPDPGFNYLTQVVIAGIPYEETTNSAGGTTVTIG